MKKTSSTEDIQEQSALNSTQFSHLKNINKNFSLEEVIQLLPGSAYWKNKEGVYLGYNDSMLKLAQVDELTGKTDFDLSWREEASIIRKNDHEVINLKKPLELEEVITLANGQRAVMLTKKTPLHDQDGSIVGLLGISFDISEKRNQEDQAQAAQIALNNIIANLPGHVYWKDKNGVYLGCNNRQAESLGFHHASEVVGKTDFELYSEKEIANIFWQNDKRIMQLAKTEIVEEPGRMDGQNVTVLSQKTPLWNEAGEVVGVLGISLDITSRKIDEEKNRLEKEKAESTLAYIIEHLPGHVYWKDKAFVFQGCNLAQAKSAGFSNINDVVGKTDYDMPWRNEADFLRESDLMVMNNKEAITREEMAKMAGSNEVLTFLSKKVPFLNNKGEVIGILGISLDITDRKKMEEELQQAMVAAKAASRAKTEFIANMSHDLRTPLTGILNMSSSLTEQVLTADGKEDARVLNESGQQLLELCNAILDSVSADNYTEQDIKEECFDLHQLIEAISRLEMPTIESKKLDFKIDIDREVPPYLVNDRVKLHRILLNLLGNAIKFTKTGHIGIIVKVVEKNNEKVVLDISVVDTGIGIKPELQDSVFERFFRVNASYKGLYRGYGLGLYIAKKYVRLLGGDHINLESEEGKGSRFSFVLSFKIGNKKDLIQIVPEREHSSQSAIIEVEHVATNVSKQPSPAIHDPSLSSNSPSLLLIEDNTIALRGLESLVKRASCRFKSAVDGEQGLELATTHHFDLIITDIGLPGISGIEVTEHIRAWEKLQHRTAVPIVGLTGHALQQAEKECLQAGMNKVLAKPANLDIIKNLVKQFIPPATQRHTIPSAFEQPVIPPKQTASAGGGLGVDLPDTEDELFLLEQYPLFDITVAREIFAGGCDAIIPDLLRAMAESIPNDKEEITEAFKIRDWQQVQALAHKAKGGAAACSNIRMRYACQYLERYRKAGHSQLLEKLYYQLMQVMDETKDYINDWLSNK